jgi:uncharacterized protein YabN with tetrapyrrole methylase and pyrophosphatase domain
MQQVFHKQPGRTEVQRCSLSSNLFLVAYSTINDIISSIMVKMKNLFKGVFKRKVQKDEQEDKTTTTANIKCKECGAKHTDYLL